MPKRIQRKRTKGWRKPENTVIVTRPGKWGNPFKVGDKRKHAHVPMWDTVTPDNILSVFESYACDRMDEESDWLAPLRGKDLACFCPLDSPCHADILLRLANQPPPSAAG